MVEKNFFKLKNHSDFFEGLYFGQSESLFGLSFYLPYRIEFGFFYFMCHAYSVLIPVIMVSNYC